MQSDGKKCGACVKKCPKDCIAPRRAGRRPQVEVGNIVLATGYDVFDATRIERYGYGRLPNVLTALEFERLTNASGPTGGRIVMQDASSSTSARKADEWVFEPDGPRRRASPSSTASARATRNYNAYCSRVCCMYSLKFAHLVREKLPDADCYEFYIDMRAFGKGYEEFVERIKAEGTFVVRGRSATVTEPGRPDGRQGRGHPQRPAGRVPGGHGASWPSASCRRRRRDELAGMLGIPRDDDGWFAGAQLQRRPTETERGGVYVAGHVPGAQGHPRHGGPGLGGRGRGAEEHRQRAGTGSRSSLTLDGIESAGQEPAPASARREVRRWPSVSTPS